VALISNDSAYGRRVGELAGELVRYLVVIEIDDATERRFDQ
jgi:hypothetical protein